jgi:hypothetical protein
MPRGVISNREYTTEDIFSPIVYPRMKEEPLLDDDDCLVVPVRNENAPHFRRLGNPSFGNKLGRTENNPTHDNCVKYLLDELSNQNFEGIEFSTYVFADDGSRDEQIIFTPLNDSNYLWFKENDAKIAFSDETYIQSDLAGRDVNKFFPRSSYPNIIIEVIRTHHPEYNTFEKLFELSKMNHHIYFYFIAENKNTSKLNHIRIEDNILKIRLSHYMIGGQLFKNGKPYAPKQENETFEHWYNYLENSFFTLSKEKA